MTDKEKAIQTGKRALQDRSMPTRETTYNPDVDIWEGRDSLRVTADMPGVDEKSVEVTAENGVLTIEGSARIEGPEGYELVGQEFGAGRFRRDFVIPDQIDTGKIRARMKHGVLELVLPKREEIKARKIEITN